jgi:hypothetical protein
MTEAKRIQRLFQRLRAQPRFRFPNEGPLDITCDKGVYIIYSLRGIVLHVGNTPSGKKGLCQRLNNHIYGQSSFVKNYMRPLKLSVRNKCKYQLLKVSKPRDRALLESFACGMLCPKHLGTNEKINKKVRSGI